MKILLIGKTGSVTHWLEDAAVGFRAEGHVVAVGAVRRSWLAVGVEDALIEPLAEAMARRAVRFAPDLVLAIGGFHVPLPFLRRLAGLPGRPPLAGWVGDVFDETRVEAASLYDLVAYTDSGLLARHQSLAFRSRAIFLPHAAARGRMSPNAGERAPRMVMVANATAGRIAAVSALAAPMAIHGPGWPRAALGRHEVHPGRVAHAKLASLYARHMAVLNIRNEHNVLAGLNQRSFDPCLSGTAVVSDAQADLELCFAPGSEVLVWRDVDDLNAVYDRLRRCPEDAVRIGEAGRRRVLAEHGFEHRLATLRDTL